MRGMSRRTSSERDSNLPAEPEVAMERFQEQSQRIPGIVTSRYSNVKIEQCSCNEEDIQELVTPFPVLLDRLIEWGWQLKFPYHSWYNYIPALVGSILDDSHTFYPSRQVKENLLPLLEVTDIEDYRNIMKTEVCYSYNQFTGQGTILVSMPNGIRHLVAMTEKKSMVELDVSIQFPGERS